MENNTKKLSFKHYLIIGSMLFGMFFGAGNLIFPIHLGQLASAHWMSAGIGFLLTGTLLPLLAIIAIAVTHSNGIYDLAKPIGSRYATFFMVLVCATLGPLFATPRTATTPFQIAFASHLNPTQQPMWLLIYSLIFFGITFWASRKPTGIINSIGKILNPEGYNTMDCIAGLLFGIAIVTAIKSLGATSAKEISMTTMKSGALGIGLEAIIYIALIWLGATSLGSFKLSIDGGIAFNQIANHFMGITGEILLAMMATLTCLTTAVGLSTSFSEALHAKFPSISYRTWLIIATGMSFGIANFGLDTIIAWSTPMLMFLYPLAITLIILSIASPLFNHDRRVYIWTTIFTIIPAILDAIAAAPAIISKSAFASTILKLDDFLPGASLGMDWLLPAAIGLIIGLAIHYIGAMMGAKTTQIEND
ncbi:branched-chain amino acid transport system II carrier protein [Lentilactobacillus buchneri]|nr:branched-chain amino acid transport system II carrier protein [Lentilactobacillus sp. Egmn17]